MREDILRVSPCSGQVGPALCVCARSPLSGSAGAEVRGQGGCSKASNGAAQGAAPRPSAERTPSEEGLSRELENRVLLASFPFFTSVFCFLENTSSHFTVLFLDKKRRQSVKMRFRCEVIVE